MSDIDTNIQLIQEFTDRLQVAVIGAEETTANHEYWVTGPEDGTIDTQSGTLKTLRGQIADWKALGDQSVADAITGYNTQISDKLVQYDSDFVNYLLTIGFEPAVLYAAAIDIERHSQTVVYDGVTYYWSGTLPYTTTGDFLTETDWVIAPITGGIEVPEITFASGGTLVRKTQSVLGSDGEWYYWTGSFPKTITAGSTVADAGGLGDGAFKLSSGVIPSRPMMKILTASSGYVLNTGSFEYGATITDNSQILLSLYTGRLWRWSGSIPKIVDLGSTPESTGGVGEGAWVEMTSGSVGGSSTIISDVMPVNVATGTRWYNLNDGRTYILYGDGDSVQWVEENPQSASEELVGAVGGVDSVGNAARSPYYKLLGVDFSTGATITSASHILKNTVDSHWYRWAGALPKEVPAGATPETNGGIASDAWVDEGTGILKHSHLEDSKPGDGSAHNADDISIGNGRTLGDAIYADENGVTHVPYKVVVGDVVFGVLPRDTYQVQRELTTDTDCHGFSDNTQVTNHTDVGTYASFDAKVSWTSPNNANHLHAYQDRNDFSSSATIDAMMSFWSLPTHSGSGTVSSRVGAYIGAMAVTGGGTLSEQTGILIQNLAAGASNSALVAYQDTGYTCYAPNSGRWHCGGNMAVGGTTVGNVPLTISNRAYVGGKAGFFDATSIEMVSSGGIRLQVKSGSSAVTAGINNAQSLGDASTLWTEVYAASNVINQSDRRVKEQIEDVPSLVVKAWSEVPTKRFKYVDSVNKKGDKARWHIGKIAQDVVAAFEKYGLDATEYAVLCYDEWPEQVIEHPAIYDTKEVEKEVKIPALYDNDGVEVQKEQTMTVKEKQVFLVKESWSETIPAGNRYGIRYEQAALLDIEVLKSMLNS
jgi:hypothetical protein